jgi:DNA uptake protein ComE-like DNA-binding protein
MSTAKLLIMCTATVAMVAVQGIAGQVGKSQGLLNADSATEQELTKVPHITPALATTIVGRRPFKSPMELHAVLSPTLNAGQLKEVYAKVFLPLNLNTATREEILLVPGVGARLAHEFEEYRPYRTLAQFRKEIGKYVDETEVARLEQYVFVPINLNTASDADLMTIPKMGPRMLHEFKEYRPYKSIEQFRKEIGKYVDDKEVARFERYVTLG